jgi:hypothetical protein
MSGDDHETAVQCVGPDARIVSLRRFHKRTAEPAVLQCKWQGQFGSVWLDVPMVEDHPAPKDGDMVPSPYAARFARAVNVGGKT